MRYFHGLSIRAKLALITAMTTLAPLVLATVAFIVCERRMLEREAVADLATAASLTGPDLVPALRAGEPALAELTRRILDRPGIIGVAVVDSQGRNLAQSGVAPESVPAGTGKWRHFGPRRLELRQPIESDGAAAGAIVLVADLAALKARLRRDATIAAFVALFAGLAAYALGAILHRDIAASLQQLEVAAQRLAGNRDSRLRASRQGDGELDRVIDSFNSLLDQLQVRDTELRTARDELERRVAERTGQLVREQARFQCIFDAAPIGLSWMVGEHPETRIINPAHARITGVPVEKCRQLGSYREATHPDDRRAQDALHAQLVAGRIDHYDIDKRYVHADGSERWVTLSVRFHRDAATGEMQEVNSLVDITERRRAEYALADASARLGAMMENTPDFIYFKDLASRFVHCSRAFVTRFNLADPRFLIGKTDFDLFTPEHAQPAFDDEQKIIRTGIPVVGKVEKETYADGRTTWAMTTKMPWRDAGGQIIGTFGLSKDVSELKEAEATAAYERDLLQILLDNTPDPIYFKDRDLKFVRVSRSHVESMLEILRARQTTENPNAGALPPYLSGVGAFTAWLIGKSDRDVLGDRVEAMLAEERKIIRTAEPILQRLEHTTRPDGRVTWQIVSRLPWRDRNGAVVGTFGTFHDITPIKEAEAKLAATHKQMLELSRQAGMAEVATGVLHNVGNVLNSINVSASLVSDQLRRAKALRVEKLAALVMEHSADLGAFITTDPRGRVLPEYLQTLAKTITDEHAIVQNELEALRKNIDHVKEIVAMQQSYASSAGMLETVAVPELVEDALRINAGSLARHDVTVDRDYQARGVITTDKHKVIQILINLVRNAKYACDASGRTDKQITVRTAADAHGIRIQVVDNGVGIPAENLTRVFSHGFTTRPQGHGFGLHSGALAARELGGSLVAESDGVGRGAIFTLALPYRLATSAS